tara:strand:- start:1980 stop:2267 length:288 start_codon:yes stop_codon:yes gene_type:complete
VSSYKWEKINGSSPFRCEFNLETVFKSYFSPDLEYFEDDHECGLKATYKISDENSDFWVCGRHMGSLFPTVKEEIAQTDKERLKKIRDAWYKKRR